MFLLFQRLLCVPTVARTGENVSATPSPAWPSPFTSSETFSSLLYLLDSTLGFCSPLFGSRHSKSANTLTFWSDSNCSLHGYIAMARGVDSHRHHSQATHIELTVGFAHADEQNSTNRIISRRWSFVTAFATKIKNKINTKRMWNPFTLHFYCFATVSRATLICENRK